MAKIDEIEKGVSDLETTVVELDKYSQRLGETFVAPCRPNLLFNHSCPFYLMYFHFFFFFFFFFFFLFFSYIPPFRVLSSAEDRFKQLERL